MSLERIEKQISILSSVLDNLKEKRTRMKMQMVYGKTLEQKQSDILGSVWKSACGNSILMVLEDETESAHDTSAIQVIFMEDQRLSRLSYQSLIQNFERITK